GEQPDRRQRLLGPLHARADDRRRGDLRAADPAVPGLDVPRVPCPRRRRARGLTVRALDQRLLRRARPVRRLLALDVVLGGAAALLVLVPPTLLPRPLPQPFPAAPP